MEEITEALVFEKYPAYKYSGVEWLGEIPEHWKVMRIRTIAEIVNGATPSSGIEAYWDGDILWVTPAEINNIVYLNDSIRKITDKGYKNCGTSLVPKGSIILTTRAPIGKLAIANKALCTNQGCKSIKLKDHNSEYLYFQLSIRTEEINALGTGTTFMELGNTELKNLQVICPPINEQKAITSFLESKTELINQAITQKERQIELLKERRQILIHNAVTRGLNPDVTFKDSGVEWIGEIPEHWVVKKMKMFCFITKLTGFEYTNSWKITEDGEIIALRGFNIAEGRLNLDETENISKKLSQYLERSKLRKGDIVYPCTGTIGNAALIEENDKFHINQNIAKIRPNNTIVNSNFLLSTLLSFSTKSQIDFNNSSQMQPVILIGGLRNISISIPPLDEQIEIVFHIELVSKKMAAAVNCKEKEIQTLKEYKATLINSAVTGKIKVA